MDLNISGHHVEVTDALRAYVITKMERIERHFDNITSADVTLTLDNQIQRCEGKIHVAGSDIYADAEGHDMYAALDLLSDKLDRQVIKYKEKILSTRKG